MCNHAMQKQLGRYTKLPVQPNPLPDLGEYTVTRKDGPKAKLVGTIKHETAKAICLVLNKEHHPEDTIDPQVPGDPYGVGLWIPFSQVFEIHKKNPVNGYDTDSLIVTEWICRQKGLVV